MKLSITQRLHYYIVEAVCPQGDIFSRGEMIKMPDKTVYMDEEGRFSEYGKPKRFDTHDQASEFIHNKYMELRDSNNDPNVYLLIHPNLEQSLKEIRNGDNNRSNTTKS